MTNTTITSSKFGIEYTKIDLQNLSLDNSTIADKIKADLKKYKYILFKGQAPSSEEFLSFSDILGNDFVSYKGGAYVREKVKKGNNTLLSVTGGSKMKMAIPMHGEMHYKQITPPLLWFCCQEAPTANGETTLCDAAMLFDSLSIQARSLFLNNQIQYIRTYDEARWNGVFQTTDIKDAIPFFEANGLEYSMDQNQTLTTRYTCSALRTTEDGQEHFINNILPVCYQEQIGMTGNIVRLENGNPIPEAIVEELIQKSEELKVNVQWNKGDVVLIDNFRTMHGRNKITCDQRNIVVRMSN